jgi:hypothetical protein
VQAICIAENLPRLTSLCIAYSPDRPSPEDHLRLSVGALGADEVCGLFWRRCEGLLQSTSLLHFEVRVCLQYLVADPTLCVPAALSPRCISRPLVIRTDYYAPGLPRDADFTSLDQLRQRFGDDRAKPQPILAAGYQSMRGRKKMARKTKH